MKRIMLVFGTRPEAIKMAPIVTKLHENGDIEAIVTVTAQHREMLDQVLNLFQIKPKYDLNIMSAKQTLSTISTKVLMGMCEVFEASRPDIVLVHGDTTTSFMTALSAFYHKIPVAHVEAGLRTRNKYSPFPEEMNRKLTASLCDLHFAPTDEARKNLVQEGISESRIFVTGNTVIDALYSMLDEHYEFDNPELRSIDLSTGKTILLTCHRRENLDGPMERIFAAIHDIVQADPDVSVIFPMHKNPSVRQAAWRAFNGQNRVHLIEPVEYKDFCNLMSKVTIILSDSGGIQEEAPSLGKPVLVLRDTTERPEAVSAGTVLLVGTSYENIRTETEKLLEDQSYFESFKNIRNPYGDGHAAEKIAELLISYLGEYR